VSASSEAAQSWSDLSLNNLGVTILSQFGLTREDTGAISILVMVLYILVSVVIAAVSFAAFTGNQKVRASIYRDMTVAVHRHLLRLSLAYFNSRKSGELVGRLTNDIRATVNFMDGAPREVLRSCSRLAISLTILIGTNAVLTFWILLLGMTHFLITQITVRRVKKEIKRYFAQFAKVNATLFESVTMIRLVKSFGAEVHDAERVARDSDQMRRYSIAFAMSRYYQEPMRLVLDATLAGAILWLAFDAIGKGTLTVQAALLFFYLAQQTIDPISMLSRQLFGMHQTLAGASNVVEILEETTTLPDGGVSPPALKDSIQFRGVSYAYLQGEEVLQDIDLEIKRGEMVALVGP
ncbi:MAG: ABC transporter ATP-binding protein, partial [Saprospiraceae bacterium]|nr:ABC transporter ATP-binding protein [Saprospiraceae bacterium]